MKGDISKTLKEYRNKAKISVKEISTILTAKGFKASESTIYSWENGNSQPTPGALLAMCEAYEINDILKAFGYNGYNEDGTLSLNMYEIDLIEKYRTLDSHGQNLLTMVLDEEVERCTAEKTPTEVIDITYYHQLASAGNGEYLFNDLPTDTIKINKTPEAENADFVLKVSGDSMEPTIKDGELLLVKKTPEINIGEIGIFIDQYDCYVKELGKDGLISHNKKYPIMIGSMYVRCVGKVLGTAEEA